MNPEKITDNIVENAKQEAKRMGYDPHAYALGVVEAKLELAIIAIIDGQTESFLQSLKVYDNE